MPMIICSDEDDLISVSWIDTVRASLTDNQRQSQHEHQPINGQRQSSYGADVIKPRPVTVLVLLLTFT